MALNTLRKVTSFSRRMGKGFNNPAKSFYAEYIEKYKISANELKNYNNLILEIGFGAGEHLLGLSNKYNDHMVIGAEPYLDGVVKVLKTITKYNISNLKLFPDDVNLLLTEEAKEKFNLIYILFPDPWPKTRHHKRRIINQNILTKVFNSLKDSGKLVIATDHLEYAEWIHNELEIFGKFKVARSHVLPHNYTPTKYHTKALKVGSEVNFFNCIK
ncbi:MAG: tRNA (guanosine(46)-N7)-methyltransferase TrmB [Sphingobacteriia bacterium]|nr:tRNA (guanosine(46)-N7)-methyltransferase TrmB [Sphingobacteriia bacterium]